MSGQPVDQGFRTIALYLHNQRTEGGLDAAGAQGSDSHCSCLPVEEHSHSAVVTHPKEQPAGGGPYVPVPQLVVELLETASSARADSDASLSLFDLIGAIAQDVARCQEDLGRVFAGSDGCAQDYGYFSASFQLASSIRPRS